MKPMQSVYLPMGGGVDGVTPLVQMNPGRLRIGQNVECKPGGGYRRIEGYEAFDDEVVPGSGRILGVHYYNGRVYAFRNAADGLSCAMYSSTGDGWRLDKSGLTAGGRYRLINYAFSGTQKMYGVSGKHKAFQWDGASWTDITTGMSPDEPRHIFAHKKHLFLSFGNSVQHSSLGNPASWSALTGAGEILLDQDVTGFSGMPNGSLGIFTRSSIMLLAGSSSADWVANNMVEYGNNAGALPDTIQGMGSAVRFTDSRGIVDLAAADVSSDFRDAMISNDIDDLVQGQWTKATASTVIREKSQYRVFFNDGTGVIVVFVGNRPMLTRLRWPNIVRCCINTEDAEGNELVFFGSDDGYIYQMESGRGLGGQGMDSYIETAFTDLGMKHSVKRFRRARFDVGKYGKSSLIVSARFIVDDGGLRRAYDDSLSYQGDGAPLGPESTLGQTVLGGLPLSEGTMEIPGEAQYLSFIFTSNTNNEAPWEIDGISVDFFPGRKRR